MVLVRKVLGQRKNDGFFMNIKKYWETYNYYSGKTSEIVRGLGFAGIALVWLFRLEGVNGSSIPRELILPAIYLILGLALDLFHYAISSIVWGIYARFKEQEGLKISKKLKVPIWINWPGLLFFVSKIMSIVFAYCFLLNFLFHKYCFD